MENSLNASNAIANQNAEISKDSKIQNPPIAKDAKKDAKKGIDAKNLSSLLDGLGEIKNPSHSIARGNGGYLYKYSENPDFIKSKKSLQDFINGLEGKNYRNKRRNSLRGLIDSFFWGIQSKNEGIIQKSLIDFDKEYKLHYSLNDYSLSSIAGGKKDAMELKRMERFLEGIRKMKGMK